MVKEYTTRFYVPLMERGQYIANKNYAAAERLQEFKRNVSENWEQVEILNVKVNKPSTPAAGDQMTVKTSVRLGAVQPQNVIVELIIGKAKDRLLIDTEGFALTLAETSGDSTYGYNGTVSLTQGALGFTVRVRPTHPDLVHPFEAPLVTWAPEF
jgi:starch phosphorylase